MYFFLRVRTTAEPYDTDEMAREFIAQFPVMAFSKGQDLVFSFQRKPNLKLTVKAFTGIKQDSVLRVFYSARIHCSFKQ